MKKEYNFSDGKRGKYASKEERLRFELKSVEGHPDVVRLQKEIRAKYGVDRAGKFLG